MAKPNDDVIDLKRRLSLLDRLDDGAIRCADGVFLVRPARVRDPRPLVRACEVGWPESAALAAAMAPCPPLLALGRELLAAAHRDLRVIEAAPARWALAREAPRIFRRYGDIDEAWIAKKRARLATLSEMVREAELRPADPGAAWFDRVLALVRLIHGDAAARAVTDAERELVAGSRDRRRGARRALGEVIDGIARGRAGSTPEVETAIAALRSIARLPGRARARRVHVILRALFGLGERSDHAGGDAALPLVEQVRAVGARLLTEREGTEGPALRERARLFLAHHALAFDPVPRDGGPLSVPPDRIEPGLARLRATLEAFADRRLTLVEVLALSALPVKDHLRPALGRLVEGGFPIALFPGLAAIDQIGSVALIEDPRAAEAYATFAATLVPHYRALGLDVPIRPEMFASMRSARREDLGVLAVCLMKHHTRVGPAGADRAIADLDATLGLFRRRPAEAASVLADLGGTSKGAGRAAFPGFAAWLGDDALLDRHVHLTRLAGLPVTLSRALRSDFDRREALDRERAHLGALPARSAAQEARLARLSRGEVEVPDPGWTRRRLAERAGELSSLAYEARLGAVLRALVKEVWGISIGALTPAWRDAIRFYFAIDDNHELLGAVLRGAAQAVDPKRSSPANRAFITEAARRFDVEAWLAPRARDVRVGGVAHHLAVERDPIEVLRMGIPFGTCLSLEDGCNAASTVINAADANKQVIYLRDRPGNIVARQLVAVSSSDALIGYRVYVAAAEHREEILALFDAFTADLAAAARIPRASTGKPAEIHQGFWYDDGVEPFDRAPDPAIDEHCRSLGVRVPAVIDTQLAAEARIVALHGAGDEAAVLAALADVGWSRGPFERAARWLVDRLAPEARVAAARRSYAVILAAARREADRGPIALLDFAASVGGSEIGEIVARELSLSPKTAEIASALVSAGLTARARAESFDDHGLEHQVLYLLPAYLAEIPVAAAFTICDRVEPLLSQILAASNEGCRDCVEGAEHQILDAIARRYPRDPDPDRVLARLASGRSSTLARRAALRIAALFPLAEDAPPAAGIAVQRVRPCASARSALGRLRRRAPDLEGDPDLFAALLRQSAGSIPRGLTLPVPRRPPFEALGDLLVQLDLEPALAPWLTPPDPPSSWAPGPWELHFHRRRRTPLRAALFTEAKAHAPDPSAATDTLAWLGDTGALDALDLGAKPRARRHEGGSAQLTTARARVVAADIAAQIAAADAPAGLALSREALQAPRRALGAARRGVDPGLVLAASACVTRHLDGEREEATSLRLALDVVLISDAPTALLFEIVDRLLARGEPSEIETAFITEVLCERAGFRSPHLTPARVVTLLRAGGLRTALFEALARTDEVTYPLRSTLDHARREGGDDLAEEILDGWVRALVARGNHDAIVDIDDEGLFRRVIAVLLAQGSVAAFLRVYEETRSHAEAVIMLDVLGASPHLGAPSTRAAVEGMRGWGRDTENAARYAWLCERLKRGAQG